MDLSNSKLCRAASGVYYGPAIPRVEKRDPHTITHVVLEPIKAEARGSWLVVELQTQVQGCEIHISFLASLANSHTTRCTSSSA